MENSDLRGRLVGKVITEITMTRDEITIQLVGVSENEEPELLELKIKAGSDGEGCQVDVRVRPG